MDLSQILNFGQSPTGLLSPEQQSNATSAGLMNMAAALLKSSGPSPYKAKMTTLSGLGEGLQAGLLGRQNSIDEGLKQQLVRGQITQQQLGAIQAATEYKAAGLPVPPLLQHILDAAGGGSPGMPAGGVGGPNLPAPAPVQGMPGPPGPASAPALPPGTPPSMAAIATGMGLSPYGLVSKGPIADITKAVIAKNLEQTNEGKNARDPAVEADQERKAIMEGNVKRYGALSNGIQAQGHTSANMIPQIQLAKSLINSPDFYSGTGEGLNLAWKRAVAAIGGDQNAPLPQEAFRKVMAANILHQVDDMKAAAAEMGGASSRIFSSQIDMMEKAAQNPDNSPAANRFLTELAERAAKRNVEIADMASDYEQQHGRLGPAFEKQLRKFTSTPFASAEELKDPRLIAQKGGGNGPSAVPQPGASAPAATATNPKTGQVMHFINGQWVSAQ